MRFHKLLSWELPIYGRALAGTAITATTHHNDETTRATPPAASWRTRCQNELGAATKYVKARAGTTRSACNILVMKPNPTKAKASTNHRVEAFSVATVVA